MFTIAYIYTHINGALSEEGVIFVLYPELNIYLLPKITEQLSNRDEIRIMKSANALSITTLSHKKKITTFDLLELQSTQKR